MIDMIRNNLSANSRDSSPSFSRYRGFTMVEVVMSVVLISIGTTLAIPSYVDMVEKRRLTNSAEQLASFISSAQSISTRTNQIVTVSYERAHHDEWCIGASLSVNECDCDDVSSETYCEIDAQPFVLDESLSNGSELMHSINGGSYSFDPVRGLSDGTLTMELHSDSRDFRLDLLVNNTGRVILCSNNYSDAVPGYDVCPLVAIDVVSP
jgi:type IV fimbrial biogenesis protein FimT